MKIIKKIMRKKGLFILFSLIVASVIGFPTLYYLSKEKRSPIPKKSTKSTDKKKTSLTDEKRDKSWQEIQNFAQAKNLKEVDFNHYKNQIYHQTNNKDLEQKKQKILAEISELVDSTSETEKTAKQQEFQDQEKKEQKEKDAEEAKKQKKQEREKEQEHQEKTLGEWIKGDDIYNFYNSLKKEKAERVLFLDPLYLGGVAQKKGKEFSSSIKRLVEKKLNKNDLVFMPANQTNLHWSLIIYEKSTRTLHLYDSLNSLNFDYFSPLCKELLKNITPPSLIKQEKTPQQTNGSDCGVYVMSITQFLADRYKKNPLEMKWEISDDEELEIHKSINTIRQKGI